MRMGKFPNKGVDEERNYNSYVTVKKKKL